MLENLNNLSDNIEQGRPIKGDFTLQDLINKVDSVKASLSGNASSGPMSSIAPVIDNMKNILVRNNLQLINQVVCQSCLGK